MGTMVRSWWPESKVEESMNINEKIKVMQCQSLPDLGKHWRQQHLPYNSEMIDPAQIQTLN